MIRQEGELMNKYDEHDDFLVEQALKTHTGEMSIYTFLAIWNMAVDTIKTEMRNETCNK